MIEALLEAARDKIIAALSLTVNEVGIQPKGHPPATMGDVYISLDEAGVISNDRVSLKESFNLTVWITRRGGIFPQDRRNEAYLAQSQQLTMLERSVIVAIHTQQDVRIAACNLLGITTAALTGNHSAGGGDGAFGDAFQLPLYYLGRGATDQKSNDWIGSESEDPESFFVRALQFSGGLRIQHLEIMK